MICLFLDTSNFRLVVGVVDEKENKRVRLSLVLYYTALYYDNVDLLHELLKENVKFEYS